MEQLSVSGSDWFRRAWSLGLTGQALSGLGCARLMVKTKRISSP